MALNFPLNPNPGDQHTVGSTTWQWDGTAWIKAPNQSTSFGSLTATSVVISSVTNAVSTVTGSLVVYGGVGIGGDLWLGGDLYAQGHYVLTTATFANGIVSGSDINAVIEVGSGAVIISNTSTLQSVTTRGSTTTNRITVTNTSQSVSTTTGALIVVGGVGIGGNLSLNGKIYAAGTTGTVGQVLSTTPTGVQWANPVNTFNGGAITQSLSISDTTNSTSTTTGALTISGGVGIGRDVWVGGRVNSESTRIADTIFDSTVMTVNTMAPTVIDSFSFNQYRSAKYMIQISDGANNTDITGRCQVTELMLLVSNTGTVNILEYGNIFPQGDMGNFDADLQSSIVSLTFIANDVTDKTVKVLRTAMAV
jgi:hypothetical protein